VRSSVYSPAVTLRWIRDEIGNVVPQPLADRKTPTVKPDYQAGSAEFLGEEVDIAVPVVRPGIRDP